MVSIVVAALVALGLAAILLLVGRLYASRRAVAAQRDALRRRVDDLLHVHEVERAALADEARSALHEAERAARARDDLVTTVSRELRTPLNAVLGWARLLRSGPLEPSDVARGLETIERSASAQAQLVDDLLDVARIERGDLRLEVRPVELASVVEAAIAAIRPAAAARGIGIATVLVPGIGPVSGDPGRLQQVVGNLLSNAVRSTPPRGRIEVRVEQQDAEAVVRVSDTGEGIAPAFLPHVFERPREADGSSARTHGGRGLRLALVRHLVEAHGGTVSAHSAGKGKGAAFTVRLPLSGADPRPPSGTSGARPPPGHAAPGGPGAA